ncbi:hypothetical protein W822_07710 [Advenella kashmirensis W13003]|uniref:ABC transporter substrate-binding protein n=1 Tax=Advenella kashmirensis W13003 TaxID=1424334 RepID=V8QUN2_9BURK|nr:tripartite tricarboxylate transporter substrate binding protein [Advenella kashmirensis]ETF02724.1 hypothetical protein W822_07710 [Advenella kashmirensis W13003]
MSSSIRHLFLSAVATCCAVMVATTPAYAAKEWPRHPITLIVPYTAGGPVDTIARVLSPALEKQLGQTVVVENKPGASGLIGINSTLKAKPDGYTFGFGVLGIFAIAPHLNKLPFSLDEIGYVSLLSISPHVFAVNPAAGNHSLKELIENAKKHPDAMNFGSPGTGSSTHLDGLLLNKAAGINLTHIPYKGGNNVLNALAANEIQMTASEISAVLALKDSLKIVAVMGDKRSPVLPDVPTTTELGYPEVTASSIYGIITPKATPVAIIDQFRHALAGALKDKAVGDFFARQGQVAQTSSSEAYKTMMDTERAKWKRIIDENKIVVK